MKKNNSIHYIWMLLILLTISTYLFGYFNLTGITVVSLLILTAFIKGVLIIREFMELRGVSLLWRVIMYGWLSVVCLAIIIAYSVS